MKYKIKIRNDQDEDLVIYAKEDTDLLERIENLLKETDPTLFGYDGARAIRLEADEISCFFIESGRTYAHTKHGKLLIKERLYRIEEVFGDGFVKINQSCLINVSKIKRFDSSIGGALLVVLEDGYRDYVSRRQLKSVKERMSF